MSLDQEDKQKLVQDFGRSKSDTGSPEIQVALWTERIKMIAEHLKTHKKDKHSRRGLVQLVHNRRKMLVYLKRTRLTSYQEVIQRLGLRG